MKKVASLCLTLILCAMLVVPIFAYPAGIDKSLPRVVDNDMLFFPSDKAALEEKIAVFVAKYEMDVVILTTYSLDGKEPNQYAYDYFDNHGYGWRDEATDDVTTGSGVILLLGNMKADSDRDIEIAAKGFCKTVFGPQAVDYILDDVMIPLLREKRYVEACEAFLREAGNSVDAYIDQGDDYNAGTYGNDYTYTYSNGSGSGEPEVGFNGGVFFVGLIVALIITAIIVSSMKKKMNTARPQRTAGSYILGETFRLTQQQDIFLYSNTTRVRIDTESSSSGGGSTRSGGGSGHSSSGSSFSGGGRRF